MKVGFVAYDMGPSKYTKIVADEMVKRHEIVFVPPQKKDLIEEYGAQLALCDLIVLGGPASFDTEIETGLLDALPGDIPLVILEDVPGSCLRPKFKKYTQRVKVVIGAFEQWQSRLLEFGYAHVAYLGYPQNWKDAYDALTAFSSFSSKRRDFTKYNAYANVFLPLSTEDTILFYGCVKDGAVNNEILILLNRVTYVHRNVVVSFRTRKDERLTSEQKNSRDLLLGDPLLWQLVTGDATMSETIAACDIPIFSGGATDSIACALARKSAIYCTSKGVRENNRQQGVPDDGVWFVEKLGGALVVDMNNGPD